MTKYDYNFVANHIDLFLQKNNCTTIVKNKNNSNKKSTCAICQDSVINNTRLACKHEYCFSCVNAWFRVKNTCPLCREKSSILINDNIITKIKTDNIKNANEEMIMSDDNREEETCSICGLGGKLLICDHCDGRYGFYAHVLCAGYQREDTPEEDWFCVFCR